MVRLFAYGTRCLMATPLLPSSYSLLSALTITCNTLPSASWTAVVSRAVKVLVGRIGLLPKGEFLLPTWIGNLEWSTRGQNKLPQSLGTLDPRLELWRGYRNKPEGWSYYRVYKGDLLLSERWSTAPSFLPNGSTDTGFLAMVHL